MTTSYGVQVSINVEGVKAISRDALSLGVSLSDLTAFNYRMAKPIANLARELAPIGTRGSDSHKGRLKAGIKPSRSKLRIAVGVGNNGALNYAAVVHWDRDGKSGPKFLSVAEERLRPQILASYDTEMHKLLQKYGWM